MIVEPFEIVRANQVIRNSKFYYESLETLSICFSSVEMINAKVLTFKPLFISIFHDNHVICPDYFERLDYNTGQPYLPPLISRLIVGIGFHDKLIYST